MEVGDAITYVDPNGIPQNALAAKVGESSANIIVIPTDGADDHFGKNRAELRDVPIGNVPGCCMSKTAASKLAKRIAEAKEEAARVAEEEAAEAEAKAKAEAEAEAEAKKK